jgi:hypothetical protein
MICKINLQLFSIVANFKYHPTYHRQVDSVVVNIYHAKIFIDNIYNLFRELKNTILFMVRMLAFASP